MSIMLQARVFHWTSIYRIAGKFGGSYIWRNSLQAAKNKYWWNLNLAIGNCAYKFLLRHHAAEVRMWFDWSAKTEVEVMEEFQLESCVKGHHIYKEYVDSVVGGSTFCGFAASHSMLRSVIGWEWIAWYTLPNFPWCRIIRSGSRKLYEWVRSWQWSPATYVVAQRKCAHLTHQSYKTSNPRQAEEVMNEGSWNELTQLYTT